MQGVLVVYMEYSYILHVKNDWLKLPNTSIHWCCFFIFKGLDIHCEPCQRFFQDGLMTSFTKILTDEAVSGWKFEIQVSQCECWKASKDCLGSITFCADVIKMCVQKKY